MDKITLTTEDGIELSGLLWNQDAFQTVLLIHMMPSKKESWVPLADPLSELGVNVLAIDLRGHGESGGGDYREFSPEQHYGYLKDYYAAILYLRDKYPHSEMQLGGASIGANLTLRFMAENHGISKGVALSAGFDYYGIRAIDDIQNLTKEQQVLLVGARDDFRGGEVSCGEMADQLYDMASGVKQKIVYDTGGHGTDMWTEHPELIDEIIKFFTE